MAFDIGGAGSGFAVGTLNAGATDDVAIATGSAIVILSGNGAGTAFDNPTQVATPAIGVAVDDIANNDGLNDLVSWTANQVVSQVRNGSGTFLAEVPFNGTFANVTNVLTDAITGAPRADAWVADDTGIRAFESNFDGSFDGTAITIGAPGDRLVATDNIDGDPGRDLLILGLDGSVKLSRGFGPATVVATDATAVGVGQFDGTGLRDLMVATAQGGVVFKQTSAGVFEQVPGVIPGITGDQILVTDANGDGTDDVFVPTSVVMQCPGSTAGIFTQIEPLVSAAPAQLIDIDRNGTRDLMRLEGNNLIVRLATP